MCNKNEYLRKIDILLETTKMSEEDIKNLSKLKKIIYEFNELNNNFPEQAYQLAKEKYYDAIKYVDEQYDILIELSQRDSNYNQYEGNI